MDRAGEDTATPPRYAFRLEDLRNWHVVTAVWSDVGAPGIEAPPAGLNATYRSAA
jgi:hypothetical protein